MSTLSALEEAMLLHGRTPDRLVKVKRKPGEVKASTSGPAFCPGRSSGEPCREGRKDKLGNREPARLGITVDQAAAAQANTGTPPVALSAVNPDP